MGTIVPHTAPPSNAMRTRSFIGSFYWKFFLAVLLEVYIGSYINVQGKSLNTYYLTIVGSSTTIVTYYDVVIHHNDGSGNYIVIRITFLNFGIHYV